ncbi:hypothetical protein [Enterococcus sp.]|uniref:hypothetical protein n=1 Tax=Enterococcus sp. TaxID=35783 RepID=UPI003C7246B8
MRIWKFLFYLDAVLLIACLLLFIYYFIVEKRFDWVALLLVIGCLFRLFYDRYALKKLKTNKT